MQVIRTIKKMQSVSRQLAAEGKTIGLVPTMGFLHEGHLSLIKKALKSADIVVTSIFVNPTQFAPYEDLDKYPRDENGDVQKIEQAGGDIAFIPTAEDIYPDDFQTHVEVSEKTLTLEGKIRPGHFRGVTTIVAKLFNIVRPDVAVFGMKDYQQAMVLKQMVRDLNYPIKMVIAPTKREKDGLAMSSRNKYFGPEQRPQAACLYKALMFAKNSGIKDVREIDSRMRDEILHICPSAVIDYIAFTDPETLKPLEKISPGTVCSLAVRVHGVRLIDNVKLK